MSTNKFTDRIAKLGQRFKSHSTGRPAETNRNRERRSYYMDTALSERIDTVYRELNHELYPQTISKSTFLEAIIEYALDNLPSIKDILSQTTESSQQS
jgi:hypothetical protein